MVGVRTGETYVVVGEELVLIQEGSFKDNRHDRSSQFLDELGENQTDNDFGIEETEYEIEADIA